MNLFRIYNPTIATQRWMYSILFIGIALSFGTPTPAQNILSGSKSSSDWSIHQPNEECTITASIEVKAHTKLFSAVSDRLCPAIGEKSEFRLIGKYEILSAGIVPLMKGRLLYTQTTSSDL